MVSVHEATIRVGVPGDSSLVNGHTLGFDIFRGAHPATIAKAMTVKTLCFKEFNRDIRFSLLQISCFCCDNVSKLIDKTVAGLWDSAV